MQFHKKTIAEVAQIFNVDPTQGLSFSTIDQQLPIHGLNVLPHQAPKTSFNIIVKQFLSPLMLILLIAAGISIFIQGYTDAFVILIGVVLNVVVGAFQEWRAEQAAQALKSYEVTYCTVRRNGQIFSIDAQRLIPGDIVILSSGARIPADIRLIDVVDFVVEEALLTGEAKPVVKHTKCITTESGIGDRTNIAYAGTHVVSGKAEGIVIATGTATELGKIATLLTTTKAQETPLQQQVSHFSWVLGSIMVIITILICSIGLLQGMPLHDILITSVALAVAAVPEGLAVAVTTILAIGMYRMVQRKALVKHLVAAETLGSVSVICTDKTGTLTEGRMRAVVMVTPSRIIHINQDTLRECSADVQTLLEACILNNDASNNVSVHQCVGHPTELALLKLAEYAHMPFREIHQRFSRLDEIPFSSNIKYMVTLHSTDNGCERLIVKGAPEKVFAMCAPKNLDYFQLQAQKLVLEGLRLLAFAEKRGGSFSIKQDLHNLTCLGIVGIQDPLRPQAKQTVEILKRAGIHVVIATGDHPETAASIARHVGLPIQNSIMTGIELNALSEEDLIASIDKISVFARVDPHHKIKIVNAWQKRGHAVAMTGDGVNDAPALKAADIGVALGAGSDVAEEIADMVLLDNNLATINDAVYQGRVVFDNIRKVIVYLMTDSFSEIVLIGGALFAGLPLPVSASQIFWINLVTDGFPSLALTMEPGEPEIMHEPPRAKTTPLVSNDMKFIIFIIGIITDCGLFGLYLWLLQAKLFPLAHIRTIMFTALAVDSLLYVFSVRSMRSSLFSVNIFSNPWLLGAVIGGFSIQCMVLYVPGMQTLFNTVPLGWFEWALILGLSLVKTAAIELTKELRCRHQKNTT